MNKLFPLGLILLFFTKISIANNYETFITVGNNKISKVEFDKFCKINEDCLMENYNIRKEKDFLTIFINFNLIKLEAKAQKFDTTQNFKNQILFYNHQKIIPCYINSNSQDHNISLNYKNIDAFSIYKYMLSNNIFNAKRLNFYQDTNSFFSYSDSININDKYSLLNKISDASLVYTFIHEKILNYSKIDHTGLLKYYKKHKKSFFWEERFKGLIIRCNNIRTRELAENYLSSKLFYYEVENFLNNQDTIIQIENGIWEKGSNPIIDYYVWNSPLSYPFNTETTFIRGDKIKPMAKNFEEATEMYIFEYQKFLKQRLIKKLRKKYKVKVNTNLMKEPTHVTTTL